MGYDSSGVQIRCSDGSTVAINSLFDNIDNEFAYLKCVTQNHSTYINELKDEFNGYTASCEVELNIQRDQLFALQDMINKKEEESRMEATKTLSLYKALKQEKINKEFDNICEEIQNSLNEVDGVKEVLEEAEAKLAEIIDARTNDYVTYYTKENEEGIKVPDINVDIVGGIRVLTMYDTEEYKKAEEQRCGFEKELLDLLARVEAYIADTCETKKDVEAALIKFNIMNKKGELNI